VTGDADLIDVDLASSERRLLRYGITEWGGPAHCTEEMAVAIGFVSVRDLFDNRDRLVRAIGGGDPLTSRDWRRVLLSTEVVFASDVVGSGIDWRSTTGLSDEDTIVLLRSVQRKVLSRIARPAARE
jgi:hypothetical protein